MTAKSDGEASAPAEGSLQAACSQMAPFCVAMGTPLATYAASITREIPEFPPLLDVLGVIAFFLGGVFAMRVVFRRIAKTRWQGDAATLAACFCFFGYGPGRTIFGHPLHRYWLPLWLIGGLTLVYFAARRSPPVRLTQFGQLSCVLLFMGQVAWILALLPGIALADKKERGRVTLDDKALGSTDAPSRGKFPDIYFILVDGYARPDVLQKLFAFEDPTFESELRQRGFVVPKRSRSNYAFTDLSLPSMLNMSYLHETGEHSCIAPGVYDRKALMQDNAATERLRRLGYRVRHVGSNFSISKTNGREVEDVAGPWASEFVTVVARQTLLMPLEQLWRAHGRHCLWQLETIANLKSQQEPATAEEGGQEPFPTGKERAQKPLFVVTHLLCPHPPCDFNREGLRKPWDFSSDPAAYCEQIRFLNKRLIELVDRILEVSGKDAVILFQADHGCAFFWHSVNEETPSDALLEEQMSVFCAYRVPDDAKRRLHDGITPVNLFRHVFNSTFQDRWPILSDRAFYSPHSKPFQLVEAPP